MRADGMAKLQVVSYKGSPITSITESVIRNNDWGEKWNLLRFETYQDNNYNRFNITAYLENGNYQHLYIFNSMKKKNQS